MPPDVSASTMERSKRVSSVAIKQTQPTEEMGNFVFRLHFHASRVPKSGWDKLAVSLVSIETGKPIIKSSRGLVRNGSCQWPDPIIQSTKLTLDPASRGYNKKLYKLVVRMGSLRVGILGEATINLTDYINSESPNTLSLPLKKCTAGTVLHVKIECITPKPEPQELEIQRNTDLDGEDSSSASESDKDSYSSGDLTDVGSLRSLASQSTNGQSYIPNSQRQFKDGPVSIPASRQDSFHSLSSSISKNGVQKDASNRDYPITDTLLLHKSSSMASQESRQSQESLISSTNNDGVSTTKSWQDMYTWQAECTNPLLLFSPSSKNGSRVISTLPQKLDAAEATIRELHEEAMTWERHERTLIVEAETLRQQFASECKSGAELRVRISSLESENVSLRSELGQLRTPAGALNKWADVDDYTRLELDKTKQLVAALQHEVTCENEANANLQRQLQKTQDSNDELVAIATELEVALELKNEEMDRLAEDKQKLEEEFDKMQESNTELLRRVSESEATALACKREMEIGLETGFKLDQELQETQDSNTELATIVTELEVALDLRNKQMDRLAEGKRTLEEELDKMQASNVELLRRVTESEVTALACNREMEIEMKTGFKLDQQLQETQDSNNELVSIVTELEVALDFRNKEMDKLTEGKQKLEEELDKMQASNAELLRRVSESEATALACKREMEIEMNTGFKLDQQLQETQDSKNELVTKVTELEVALDLRNKQMDRLTEGKQKLEEELDKMQASNAELLRRVSESEATALACKREMEVEMKTGFKLDQQLQETQDSKNELITKVTELEMALELRNKEMGRLTEGRQKLEEELDKMQASNAELLRRVSESEVTALACKREMEVEMKTGFKLDQQLQETQDSKNELVSIVTELEVALDLRNKEMDRLTEGKQKLEEELDKMQASNAELLRRVSESEATALACKREMEIAMKTGFKLDQQLQEIQDSDNELVAIVTELEVALDLRNKEMDRLAEVKQKLEEELDKMQVSNAELLHRVVESEATALACKREMEIAMRTGFKLDQPVQNEAKDEVCEVIVEMLKREMEKTMDFKELTDENIELLHKIHEATRGVDANVKLIALLEASLEGLSKVEAPEKLMKQLSKNNLTDEQDYIDNPKMQIRELEHRNDLLEVQLIEAKSELDLRNTELQTLMEHKGHDQSRLMELEFQVRVLLEEIKLLQALKSENQSSKLQMEMEKAKMQEKLDEAHNESRDARLRLDELVGQIAALTTTLNSQLIARRTREKRGLELQGDTEEREIQVVYCEEENTELVERAVVTEAELRSVFEERVSLKLDQKTTHAEDLQDQAENRHLNEKSQEMLGAHEQKLGEFELQQDYSSNEDEEYGSITQALDDELNQNKDEVSFAMLAHNAVIRELQQQLQEARTECTLLEEMCGSLEAEVAERRREGDLKDQSYRAEIASLCTVKDGIEQRANKAEEGMLQLQRESASAIFLLQSDLQGLAEKLTSMSNENEELEEALCEAAELQKEKGELEDSFKNLLTKLKETEEQLYALLKQMRKDKVKGQEGSKVFHTESSQNLQESFLLDGSPEIKSFESSQTECRDQWPLSDQVLNSWSPELVDLRLELENLKSTVDQLSHEYSNVSLSLKAAIAECANLQQGKRDALETITQMALEASKLKQQKFAFEENLPNHKPVIETQEAGKTQEGENRNELRGHVNQVQQTLVDQEEEKLEFQRQVESLEENLLHKTEVLFRTEKQPKAIETSGGGARCLDRINNKGGLSFSFRESEEVLQLRQKLKLLQDTSLVSAEILAPQES